MNYANWLNDWLENCIKPSLKYRTYCRYISIVKLHICPVLGDLDIKDVTPMVIQRQITLWLTSGNKKQSSINALAPNTVNGIINVIQGSLRTAHAVGYIDDYTADRIKRPRAQEKEVTCLSVKEQTCIENYCLNCKRSKMLGIVICLYTGLRVGELLALGWDDIDLGRRMIHIDKTCYDTAEGRVTSPPKTSSSIRTIPFPKQLLPIFKTLKKKTVSGFVIEHNGVPISVRSYQRSFELMQIRLNIPHRGIHALRHTFATRAIECGMDVKTLSEVLGHKNAQITLNRYAHSLIEHKCDMMNRLGTNLVYPKK